MLVYYRLSIVAIVLSLTVWPQFGIECPRRSNHQGWVTLGQNFRVFPLEYIPSVGVCKERTLQANEPEIIFEDFQPMRSGYLNVTERQTDGQTDDFAFAIQRSASHRGVKTVGQHYALSPYRPSSTITLVMQHKFHLENLADSSERGITTTKSNRELSCLF